MLVGWLLVNAMIVPINLASYGQYMDRNEDFKVSTVRSLRNGQSTKEKQYKGTEQIGTEVQSDPQAHQQIGDKLSVS